MISRYQSSDLTDADADRILAEANAVLEEVNGPGDVSCTVHLQRSGPVTSFSDGDGIIDSEAEYRQIIALPGNIKVVNAITWCGIGGLSNIIGCGDRPGTSLLVVRTNPAGRKEGILWAHEYGHNCGLEHRSVDDNEIMHKFIQTWHEFVNDNERTAYESNNASSQPGTQSAATNLKDFVRKQYIEGIPREEAQAFTAADVPVLIQMLDDPADQEWRSNIATVLGVIGDPRAVDPLIKVVGEGNGVLTPVEFGAKTAAITALGEIVSNHALTDPAIAKAFDYLKQGVTTPGVWSQRVQWTSPFKQNESQRNWQLTKAALWGMAMTGKTEAADAIKQLQDRLPNMNDVPADLAGVLKETQEALKSISQDGLKKYREQQQHKH